MIARKKKMTLIIVLSVVAVLIVIGILIALYLTTDFLKPTDKLFAKYILQNVSMIDESARQEPTELQKTLQTEKLETNLKAKLSYTDDEGKSDNSINNAELDISSKIDEQANYDYKDIRIAYENENIARMEYLKDNDRYGIRLDKIVQFVSATNQNLDELELKTGIAKKDLEFLTYIFKPMTLSQFISFTSSETEVLSSTYLGIIQQKTEKAQYKKTSQTIQVNGTTYPTTAFSIKMTQEQLNDLIISILERIEKDQILLGKLDSLEKELEKYYLYEGKEDNALRNTVIKLIDDEIQEIKNHNIGKEETEITVYVYKGQTISTLLRTPDESISLDISNGTFYIEYMQNLDNSVVTDSVTITRNVEPTAQNVNVQYIKAKDNEAEKGLQFTINQSMQGNQIQNSYSATYSVGKNTAKLEATQYIDIVKDFEDKVEFADANMNLEEYEQADVQTIIGYLKNNANDQIKTVLEHVTLDDINAMLKKLNILKENELTFIEEPSEENVTDVERTRFNSKLSFFIGKEVSKDTISQLVENAKDCIADAQLTFEDIENSDKKRLRGIIIDIRRNTSNEEKIQEINTALLEETQNVSYTVSMSSDETTKLINQVTIVANEDSRR